MARSGLLLFLRRGMWGWAQVLAEPAITPREQNYPSSIAWPLHRGHSAVVILDAIQELEQSCRQLLDGKDKRQFAEIIICLHKILHGLSSNGPLRDFNDILFFQSARFWFLLLEKMNFRQQVEDLLDELRMIRRSLELRDVRLVATVHKSHLAMVLSRLDAIEADSQLV
ncbi:hypothetical protein NXC24_PB00365 (plasmid) [Rhizobium sp. NXC24]|nr:hypothetical protein NXC24_PB00365 [Rhizobium sp. NXC24]